MPLRTVDDLDDEELEQCFDGTTDVFMVRDIFTKPGVINDEGYVDVDEFSSWFAYGLEGFIDADEDTEEWEEANDNNLGWGESIAMNINDALDFFEEE